MKKCWKINDLKNEIDICVSSANLMIMITQNGAKIILKLRLNFHAKVEKSYEDSLDLIKSHHPSPSVKIQIIDGKVFLR